MISAHELIKSMPELAQAIELSLNVGVVVVEISATEASSDHSIIYYNKGFENLSGYSQSEILGQNCLFLAMQNEDGDSPTNKNINSLIEAFEKKMACAAEVNCQRKDGSLFWNEISITPFYNSTGELTHFYSIQKDVSLRHEAQSSAADLDDDLTLTRQFLESAPDATLIVDTEGLIQVANKQMVNLFGYTHEELIGLNVDQLVPMRFRGHHQHHRKKYDENAKPRGMGSGLNLSAVSKDGSEFSIEVSLSPIETRDGKYVAAAIRDDTQRRKMEDDLRNSQLELQEAKTIADNATQLKSRFLAAASHDLRQPLQALRLYLAALSRRAEDAKIKELSSKMNLSLDSMGQLLDVLLDISALDSGSIKPQIVQVDIAEVIERVLTANSPNATKKGINLSADASHYIVDSDHALLERILENFVGNAVRYTDEGKISITMEKQQEKLKVTVCDTGLGIPEESLESIFDEYYQLDNAVRDRKKGLGLGLSIVKHIARILDYRIEAESIVDKGSQFSVYVPLSETLPDDDIGIRKQSEDEAIAKDILVMAVDDDTTIVDAMRETLDVLDIGCVSSYDGEAALKLVKDGIKPDILITDYRMPGLNGVQLVKEVRLLLAYDLPAIIITGDTSEGEIKDAKLTNCYILRKPIEPEKMIDLIETVQQQL